MSERRLYDVECIEALYAERDSLRKKWEGTKERLVEELNVKVQLLCDLEDAKQRCAELEIERDYLKEALVLLGEE